MMRSLLLLSLACLVQVNSFQFMKGWKMPVRDRGTRAAKQQFGDKKLVVITGASSALGQKTIQDLLQTGEYHVIGAYANEQDASKHQNSDEHLTPMVCDLESLDSVRNFCSEVHTFRGSKSLDRLVCQAAITCPSNDSLHFTKDGHEKIMQTNFLSHFLMTSMLLDSMVDSFDARVTMVGSPSSNNQIADLVNLEGFKAGFKDPVAMADGSDFDAVKACQDSMLCQKMFTNFLHNKYHKLTGVSFTALDVDSSDSNFDKPAQGIMEMIHKGSGAQSGVALTYKNDALVESVEDNSDLNARMYDIDAAFELFKECSQITNTEWPKIKQVTSPCPTLKVIGAVTKGKVKREELKRMRQGRPGISEPIVETTKKSKRQRVAAFADRVASAVLRQTVGRVAGVASKRILGEVPDEAKTGSFDDPTVTEADVEEIQAVINEQIARENKDKFENKKLVVLTGTSSGLGRKTALALLRTGEYHVIGAVRDLDKMEAVAEVDGFDLDNFTPMYCEMASFESVRQFCRNVDKFRGDKPLDRLVCNAGVYQPSLDHAKWSKDGHEQTMQINFLSHFLMISELMKSMEGSPDPRVTMVGSVTGNDNTVGGGGVYPIADLHDLDGFEAGFTKPIEMADGYQFNGAKAYKDSKLCLMMLANYLHTKFHKKTGITFSSMYPGCIAESPLFREKRAWFRKYFPIFMKFITGGFVGEHEAGQRLFQVVHDPRCTKSGVYWSWNGGPREGRGAEAIEKGGQISGGGGAGGGWDSIFENDQSSKVLNIDTAYKLFNCATAITGAEWVVDQHKHLEVSNRENNQVIDVVEGSTLETAGTSSIGQQNMTSTESATATTR